MHDSNESGAAVPGSVQAVGPLEEELQTMLAVASQDPELASLLQQAESVRAEMPVTVYSHEMNTYRFALGGNIEARL